MRGSSRLGRQKQRERTEEHLAARSCRMGWIFWRRRARNSCPWRLAKSDPVYARDPDAGSKYGGTLLEQWMDARKIKYPPVMEKPYKESREICQCGRESTLLGRDF